MLRNGYLMRIRYIIIISFFLAMKVYSFSMLTDTSSINYLRNGFYAAVEDEDKVDQLEEYIISRYSEDYSSYSPLILAYYGGLQTLKAKHAFNPVSKLSHLISGLNRLEEAVEKSPENLEIRFMRFSILDHVPGFLGYSEEREADKDEICWLLLKKDYTSPGHEIQKGMAEYMLESGRLNNDQERLIRELISSYANK